MHKVVYQGRLLRGTLQRLMFADNTLLSHACELQKYKEWEEKFGALGLKSVEVTGDTLIGNREMASADIILSTPEKWDSVSRKWNEMESFVCSIKLLMIDEVGSFIRLGSVRQCRSFPANSSSNLLIFAGKRPARQA